MRDFAEQLSDARKAKGYTQEQLAEYLNVSRTNISRWENGRTIPDLETVKLLSKILDCDFFEGRTLTEETGEENAQAELPEPEKDTACEENAQAELPEPEKDTACEENAQAELPEPERDTAGEANAQAELPEPEMHRAPERPAPRGRKGILLAALGAVLLCAVVVVCLMMNGKPSGAQAQVSIVPMENPVHAIHWEDYPDGVGWLYEFRIEETAGVPFTVHQLDSIIINDNGEESTHSFTGEDVAQWWGSDTLVQNSPQSLIDGFPLQDVKGVRIVLNGTDANGHRLSFSGQVELSREAVEQPEIDRSATAEIVVTPVPETAYLSDWGDGVKGWRVDFAFENVSDVPFTPDHVEVRFYAGDRLAIRMKLRYDELLPYMENEKLYAGDWPMCIPYGTNRMDATRIECVIFGTDDNGHELQFSGDAELSRDEPPEE